MTWLSNTSILAQSHGYHERQNVSTPARKISIFALSTILMRLPVLRIHVRQGTWTARRNLATISKSQTIPQTVIEKVVQKYAVDQPECKVVKAGDYVMIKPEHVMTHDNTGPVISKCVFLISELKSVDLLLVTDSNRLVHGGFITQLSLSSPLITTFRIVPRKTCPSMLR